MARNSLNRRIFLQSSTATALLAGASPVFALTGPQAETVVMSAVTDINKIIGSGKSENAMLSDFKRVFTKYADVPTIALSTLGPSGRSASNGQKRAYVAAFTDYFTRKYLSLIHI